MHMSMKTLCNKKRNILSENSTVKEQHSYILTRAGPVLRNFRGRTGGGASIRSHLTRLLGVVARNGKRRSKARQKSFPDYFSQVFAQVNIEVTRGHQRSNETNCFSLITFELRKLAK